MTNNINHSYTLPIISTEETALSANAETKDAARKRGRETKHKTSRYLSNFPNK